MKVLLNIKNNKAASLLEVLNDLPYVKLEIISDEKALLIEQIKEAVEEMKLIRAGKKKGRDAHELLKDL